MGKFSLCISEILKFLFCKSGQSEDHSYMEEMKYITNQFELIDVNTLINTPPNHSTYIQVYTKCLPI
jgi:hypothetical protein